MDLKNVLYLLIIVGMLSWILIILKLWTQRKEIVKLRDILGDRCHQNKLAARLNSLLIEYEQTAGLPDSYYIFYNGILQNINHSKASNIISAATIVMFKDAEHIPQAKYLCMEMIKQLRWDIKK
jgi:hypothetical protein